MKVAIFLLAAVLGAAPAWPAGDGGDSSDTKAASSDPDFRAGVDAWKKKDWPQLLARMQTVVKREPNNADAWNYMGYAARQQGDLDNAFKYYERALQIDPAHRDAREYLGEAYLQAGKLAEAEAQLKAKIERYRRDHPS
jgi:cytochrome c-type biogenesis protein CcmH/NrfG